MTLARNQVCSVASNRAVDWSSIRWASVEDTVRGIQIRITKMAKDGKPREVKRLSRLLVRSFSGRALAVRRVTENTGKRTPGVDNELWSTPQLKWDAIDSLTRSGYRAKPLRRVYIPKANGKRRPLGIPTMKDRAMQALYLLALQPVAETLADRNSYGFRKARSTQDAIEQVKNLLDKNGSAEWVLEGDIKGCFDFIDHAWLRKNVPMDTRMLHNWLTSGVVDLGKFQETKAGTPQGGIISPTLANMALDGLEEALASKFGSRDRLHKHHKRNKVSLVRYADDFIITGTSKDLLRDEVLPLVKDFMAVRGLELSQEKTLITHIDEGFDFLGWTVRRFPNRGKSMVLVQPSKKNVKTFLAKCKGIFGDNKSMNHARLIWKLNPVVRGWTNYHRHNSSSDTYSYVDHRLFKMEWKWAKRRHPGKPLRWVKEKYFRRQNKRDWIFAGEGVDDQGRMRQATLMFARDVKIVRHAKVKMDANPFDPVWDDYFKKRSLRNLLDVRSETSQTTRLLKKAKGICRLCGKPLTDETGIHIHHVTPRSEGGSDKDDNLIPVHPVCHSQHHVHHPAERSPNAKRNGENHRSDDTSSSA